MIGNTLAIFFDSPLPIKYLCSLEQKVISNLTLTLTLTLWIWIFMLKYLRYVGCIVYLLCKSLPMIAGGGRKEGRRVEWMDGLAWDGVEGWDGC